VISGTQTYYDMYLDLLKLIKDLNCLGYGKSEHECDMTD